MSIEFPYWDDFYTKFKNDPEKSQGEAFELGRRVGHALMAKLNLKEDDLDTLATVINAFMKEVKGGQAKVEGDKVVLRNRYFCAIMVSAKSFNIPWLWLDTNVAWPLMAGIVSAVNPNAKQKVTRARARGDPVCEHIFEIIK